VWFEPFIKYPLQAFEKGELVFTNVVQPGWWIFVAVVIALVVIGSVFWGGRTRSWSLPKRGLIAMLQVGFVLLIGGLLAGPALQISLLNPGANVVAVLVDTSVSMGFPMADGEKSRLQAARETVTDTLAPVLGELADVALFSFATMSSREESIDGLEPLGEQTRLIESIDTVLSVFRQEPLAAIVVVSDGADTLSGQVGSFAPGVPVHTVGVGPRSLPGEVQLSDVSMPSDATAGSQVTAQLLIEHTAPSTDRVMLRVHDGQRLVTAKIIELPADSPTVRSTVSFDSGDGGIRDLRFEIEPTSGDQLQPNNTIRRLLTVSERRRRVLYLEGEPRWEYKYLRRALAADDVLQLVSWLRTTERKTYRQGVADAEELENGLPSDQGTLYGFDVVVLGSLAATELNEDQHRWLVSFVAERGGSLLVLAGRESLADGGWDVQPLADALPVTISRDAVPTFQSLPDFAGTIVPTRDGKLSALIQFLDDQGEDVWRTLPPLGDLQQLGSTKPAARTLLELVDDNGKHSPLLVSQPYGLGTVAVLATSTTWRWQMRTPPDDNRHRLFWRHMLRQLAESARRPRELQVAVSADGELDIFTHSRTMDGQIESAALVGETIAETFAETVSATVTAPNQQVDDVRLQRTETGDVFSGRHATEMPGVYRVDVSVTSADGAETLTRFVSVGAQNVEFSQPVQNVALLQRIAEISGGQYWTPEEAAGIAEHIRYSSGGVRSVQTLALWDLPLIFLLLIAVKLLEWTLRRRWGRI
jgi:hypothetical protein